MHSILKLSVLVLLSGCGWPLYGIGGMDDVYRYSRTDRLIEGVDHVETRAVRLARSLDKLRIEIDKSKQGLLGKFRPYAMIGIEQQWNRAAREFAGGMYADAEVGLTRLEADFTDLRHKLLDELSSDPASKTDSI